MNFFFWRLFSLYDELHKDKIKKYYQDNKDKFCLYQKKYRESHKNNNI